MTGGRSRSGSWRSPAPTFGRRRFPTGKRWNGVEKMRAGYRATRNELVKEVLRDYRYVEATGLGVPRKIVRGMREHNGTDPDLIEEDDRFTVRLWKGARSGDAAASV